MSGRTFVETHKKKKEKIMEKKNKKRFIAIILTVILVFTANLIIGTFDCHGPRDGRVIESPTDSPKP